MITKWGKPRRRRDDPVEEGQPIRVMGRAPTPEGLRLGYRRVEMASVLEDGGFINCKPTDRACNYSK